MKDLTHYFTDSLKTSETSAPESKEVSVKSEKASKVNIKSTKTDPIPKRRGTKKSKPASSDLNNSKKSECDLSIKKSNPLANGIDLPKNNVLKDIPKKSGAVDSLKSISEKSLNENSTDNSDLKQADSSKPQKNGQELIDLVSKDENDVCYVQDDGEKKYSVQNGSSLDGNIDNNISNQTFEKVELETVLITQDDKKKKRKEKIKVLAEKKGYAKRKLMEDKEAEEIEKKLKERKNVFTNVPKKNENQTNIVYKPPAYSLFNYFSKATPEQRQKEEAAKCKIYVKADVHTPKEGDTSNSTPNLTPKSHCPKSSKSKKIKAEIKQAFSTMDEIQFLRSESLSPPPILQEKKKPNKSKWRIQFQSENVTDSLSDGESFSPKSVSKIQKENRKSEELVNSKAVILNGKENPNKSENSDAETPQLNRKDKSSKHKSKKKKDKLEADGECTEKDKKVMSGKTKGTDSKVHSKKETCNEIIILEEILPKRSASEKIAPLFIKKRKLDPTIIEARRLFLQSDMSENENRPATRKPSPIRNFMLPFPQISHVAQLDFDANSETAEIKLQLKSPCKYLPLLDVSKFKNIISINDSTIKRWITTFDSTKSSINIEEALNEIESRCKDARTMWKSIFQTVKAGGLKQSPKGRISKRRIAAKKITNPEEVKTINDHENVWIYKYKPMSTQEIVGNEQAATKLKTWLDKWKTPVIMDDGSSSDDFYSSDCSSSYSSNDCNQVAVLLGPHGCGKTASVYAVAEELGYSVLEINASSRRTGKRIFKELEEATKSHRIKKSGMTQTFLKAKTEERKIPQNSLILMEDVDIIFEEDEGFVSAAFQLASNTKRPIVMTCNKACSHLNKLAPQQLHIQFQATVGNRALALLQLISLAETGRQLSIPFLENLLESGDLRKALLQLQYLLATGHNHVLPSMVDSQHQVGISLWRKAQQYLYKPAVKSSKKRKKKASVSQNSNNQDEDVLSQLANDLESVSLISKLICIDDVSWNSWKLKSVMSLSLSEDTRPYSYLDTVSSDIADWLTFEVIQKKESSEQSYDQVSSKLLMRKTINADINSVLSQIVSSTTDQRIISVDYLPSVRTICRAEETRNSSNNKRGNRFFHYLHGTKMPTNCTNILSAACNFLQEKPEKV